MSIQRALGGVCLSSTHSRKLLTTLGFRLYYKPNRKQTSGGMAAAAWMRTMSRNLKEVRIHHCQTSKGSQGVRDFVEKYYVDIKKQNPHFPFLIRECSEVEPKLFCRYLGGVELAMSLENKDRDQVLALLQKMADTKM